MRAESAFDNSKTGPEPGNLGGSDVTPEIAEDVTPEIAEEDAFRAQLYGLLSRVLAEPMSDDTLTIVCGLKDVKPDTEISAALNGFGELATRTPRLLAEEEYSSLFYGMGSGGELHPYASYYLTGFIYEKPLADLRRDLVELGIATAELNGEPEDHIGFLMEVMHGLITGKFGERLDIERQRQFFMRHIAPWAVVFFRDLEKAESAKLYMPVGTLGKVFMELESDAFEMSAV